MGYMGYEWYQDWCDEDFEAYASNQDNYAPGSVAYGWLVARVSPSMPTSELMDAAEVLDEIFDLVNDNVRSTPSFVRLDNLTFKTLILFDAELRSLIREFISLIRDYVYVPDPSNVKVAVVNLVFEYLRHRNPDRFV
jgi:hypothetical protein